MAVTYTTNFNLAKHDQGDIDWDTAVNANFDTIDAQLNTTSVGGTYNTDVTVLSFDGGTTYVDVTSSDTIQFPNLNVGTCLYFGDVEPKNWHGLQYTMGTANIAGGAIEWQYYDGGTSSWIKINTLNTITGHSDTYKSSSFLGASTVNQDIRFDGDIVSGITESNAGATGWVNTSVNSVNAKWIRCIITSAITTTPIFSSVRLIGLALIVRDNLTRTFHGDARALGTEIIGHGDSENWGADLSQTISTNITFPSRNNSLPNSGTPAIYYRMQITDQMDTSCGLIMEYVSSTSHTGASGLVAKLRVYSASVPIGGSYSGSNAEVLQTSDFTYTASDVAHLLHEQTVTDRIDISTLMPGDYVFIMIDRDSADAGDTLLTSVEISDAKVEYRTWQNGPYAA